MQIIDFSKLFQVQYILSSETGYNFKFLIPTLVIFGAILFLSLIAWYILSKKEIIYKKLALRILNFGLTIGIIGLVLVFFRYESLPFLSLRIWMLVLALIFIIWGTKIAIEALIYLPRTLDSYNQHKNFEKYLPRTKKSLK